MSDQSLAARLLPCPLPEDRGGRLMVLAMRRMGANGVNDAAIAHHFLVAFGARFRRPLLMTRVVVHDLSLAARAPIAIAPCCCPRMTAAEAVMVDAAANVFRAPEKTRLLVGDLIDARHPDAVVAAIAAMAGAYLDAGLPIGGWR